MTSKTNMAPYLNDCYWRLDPDEPVPRRALYKSCATKELSKFIRDRKLKWPKDSVKRSALIACLEDGDSFHKFLDLPPELREHVATFYMADLGTAKKNYVLDCPASPPLTHTSRQLRKETLPLFYKTCTFDVGFNYEHSWRTLGAYTYIAHQHWEWLRSQGWGNVKSIRNLRLGVKARWPRLRPQCFTYEWRWGQAGGGSIHIIEDHVDTVFEEPEAKVEEELGKLLEKIEARAAPRTFRIEDVEDINKAIDRCLWTVWCEKYRYNS